MRKGLARWRPAVGLAQSREKGISSTTANLIILGSGLTLGLVTYQFKDNPIGATLLSAAGSVTAVALVLFLRDLLVAPRESILLQA